MVYLLPPPLALVGTPFLKVKILVLQFLLVPLVDLVLSVDF
jgi:hypothetical protein